MLADRTVIAALSRLLPSSMGLHWIVASGYLTGLAPAPGQAMPLLVCRKAVRGVVVVVWSLDSACIHGWVCRMMCGWGRWYGGLPGACCSGA